MITLGSDVYDLILQKTLNYNIQGLNYTMERMSSGYKINHAKDNAAGFSILTDLNTQIISMLQVRQNTEDGIAMLQTAEGGLEEIRELLQRLRELSVQASNSTYGSDSRNAMQTEANEIIEQIEQIKTSIKYNGMNLYETPREENTAITRLANSVRITTQSSQKTSVSNDTISNTFTSTAGGGATMASSSADSLFASQPTSNSANMSTFSAKSGDIEGAVDLNGSESKVITIDGVEYTIINRLTTSQSLSYTKDTTTGEINFYGSNFKITGQKNVSHNVVINGSYNYFYGGDLADKISVLDKMHSMNYLYGGDGDDIIYTKGVSNYLHGESGNDTITTDYSGCNIYGGIGDDTFYINGSNNNVFGNEGNDTFMVKNSSSRLYGNEDDDHFNIISGSSNIVDGGNGNNTITDNGTNTIKSNVPGANSYSIDFKASETKNININGIGYTITNARGSAQSLVYKINSNGAIDFTGSSSWKIIGDTTKAHNVILGTSTTFYGGDLNDTIVSIGSSNTIYSGSGDDNITAKYYTKIFSGDGNDTIKVTSYNNSIYSGDGDDNIMLAGKRNFVYTGAGNDIISGSCSSAVISGGSGTNTISGSFTQSLISDFGSSSNAQSIIIAAGATQKITIAGKEYTIKNNENEENILVYSYNPISGEIDIGGSTLTITAQPDVEHKVNLYGRRLSFYSGNKADTIINYGTDSTIYSQGGNDTIIQEGDAGKVFGGDGNDNIILNASMHVYGNSGDDTITINVELSSHIINGGDGNDTYNINQKGSITDDGGNNIYNINASNATVTGSTGSDTFYVKGDNNTISGAGGDDYFVIDGQNNIIDGGTGNNYYIDNGSGTNLTNVIKDPNSGGISFTYQGEVQQFTLNGKTYTITNNFAGANTIQYSFNPNTKVITIDGSNITLDSELNEAAVINIRGNNNVINGSNLKDNITIESGNNNIINGLDGDDILIMQSENNSINGGDGNDTITLNASTNLEINGENGNDTLNINSSNNTKIDVGNGDNKINVNGSNNAVSADDGNNTLTIKNSENTINLGNGKNKITAVGNDNIIIAGSGNNTIGIQGDNNNITAQNAIGTVNINGDSNDINITQGDNSIVISGDNNTYVSTVGEKNVSIVGNANTITTGNNDDIFEIKGDTNIIESLGGNNQVSIRGDSNSYRGGIGIDDVKINGNKNIAFGGDFNDMFMVSNGTNNILDGEAGERNTLIDNGKNTVYSNAVDITPRPFEVQLKVDIGSGVDKFITTSISFNLFDFSVDFSTIKDAQDSIELIDDLIKNVEEQILNIGVTTNRLQSVLDAQNIKMENLISTRSTLRDADVAEESSNYIRYQILQNASFVLMSSSRNLKAQNVLGLLSNIN